MILIITMMSIYLTINNKRTVQAPVLATLAFRESNGTQTAGSAPAACRVSRMHGFMKALRIVDGPTASVGA